MDCVCKVLPKKLSFNISEIGLANLLMRRFNILDFFSERELSKIFIVQKKVGGQKPQL